MKNSKAAHGSPMVKRTARFSNACKLVMFCIIASMVILPIIKMFANITPENIKKVLSSSVFSTGLMNSVTSTLTATVITIIIAYSLAYFMERSAIKGKGIFNFILIMPMLIPSISHGMGLIILLGNNGILTNLLHLNSNIYGFWGIVIGSVLYAFPLAFLMFTDVMRYQDSSPYEAAKVLAIPPVKQFTAITLPYLRKPLISIIFAVFTMIITDYGVPLMVGGKFSTVSVIMYQEVIGQLNFGNGCVYGAILMLPAIVAFLLDSVNKDKSNSAFIIKKFNLVQTVPVKIAGYVFCGCVSLFALFPIVSFGVLGFAEKYPYNMSFSLRNIQSVLNLNGDTYLLNSIIIALFVAVVGSLIGFITAYLTARMKNAFSKVLHLISITAMAIPGMVLGLSYVITFKDNVIYGTLMILIMVNIVHFIASPYLMMYNSFSKINENIEAVGQTLGIGRFRLIKDVFIPQSLSTLAEMFIYFFVNSMMTISAVSFLAKTSTKPISLMINQFEAQMQLESAAIVSLTILAINLIIKGLMYLLKKYIAKKEITLKNDSALRESL